MLLAQTQKERRAKMMELEFDEQKWAKHYHFFWSLEYIYEENKIFLGKQNLTTRGNLLYHKRIKNRPYHIPNTRDTNNKLLNSDEQQFTYSTL